MTETILGQFGVHGVQAHRDWPALTLKEAQAVLSHYDLSGLPSRIDWHSARPFSAAGLAYWEDGRQIFIKRHHNAVRDVKALTEEHRYIAYLHERGEPVVLPLTMANGATAYTAGEWTYEVFEPAQGVDLYRERMSWEPFFQARHAEVAGAALARLHLASEGYDAPTRHGRLLVSSMDAVGQPDLMAGLRRWVPTQFGLAEQIAAHDWERNARTTLEPFHKRLAPLLPKIRPCWGHGDWHASNLLWTAEDNAAQVAQIVDFGMADRTCAPFDLAVTIERNVIAWLALDSSAPVAYDQLEALLRGYEQIRRLNMSERALLTAFLPLVHVEFALSEVAYFGALLHDQASAQVAYDDYLLGHAQWFAGLDGHELLTWLEDFLMRA